MDSSRLLSPHLQELSQYHFNRDEFCSVIRENYPDFEEDFFDCMPIKHTDSFSLFTVSDERYILHRESGTMINWYKNLGRTNTCNKPLDLKGLEEFILLLKSELSGELQKFQRGQRGQRVKIRPLGDTYDGDMVWAVRESIEKQLQGTPNKAQIITAVDAAMRLGFNKKED